MDVAALARRLRADARRTNQRRLLVLAGDRDAGLDAAFDALAGASVADADATLVSTREGFRFERRPPARAAALLGTTRDAVVFDAHEGFSPNALGRLVGAVDGGGLLILVTPPLSAWPHRRDGFDESLAVPPHPVEAVTGRFRERLVGTLRDHPSVAVVDVDAGRIRREGIDDAAGGLVGETATGAPTASDAPSAARSADAPAPPGSAFPAAAYAACLTADQRRAVRALERLRDPGSAVVIEADRGRGKSSAAGLAAGALAAAGGDVLVTAPAFRSAREVFVRARALLADLGERANDGDGGADATDPTDDPPRRLDTAAGGAVRFDSPAAAADLPGDPDAVIVDEAAALPVRLLESFLDAGATRDAAFSLAFCTTVHGYEGAGRGFSVRFRERLAESGLHVEDLRLERPIRYARGDPVESWAARALLLDARPPVEQVVADATPETVAYRALSPDDLLADERLLREAFGLLVLAHYRTEPNDLARVLDAPNLRVRALCHDGHVVSVALLAREGGLGADTRREMYDGGRVAGNMLPDVFTSQLRDEDAGRPVGHRVMRIATHRAVRSRGLGSHLLDEVAAEFGESEDRDCDCDWLGVGFGATPRLVRFWARNGYRTVHVSTSRNETSGEYSALMLAPTSDAGRALATRHARWFRDRVAGVLGDALDDLDPDVARAALTATDAPPDLSLSAREWRVVADAAYGPGLYDAAPDAFREVALAHLLDRDADLTDREERLLVRKPLQAAPWSAVAADLDYVSTRTCMRALGEAFRPLVDRYGDETARAERARYADDGGDGDRDAGDDRHTDADADAGREGE